MYTVSGREKPKLSFTARVALEERQLEGVIIVSTKSSTLINFDRKMRYHILANVM